MSFGEEKRDAEHVNQTTGDAPVEASIQEYTPAEAKKIIHRVDRRSHGSWSFIHVQSDG